MLQASRRDEDSTMGLATPSGLLPPTVGRSGGPAPGSADAPCRGYVPGGWRTEMMFPAGSLNQAIAGPGASRAIPLASWSNAS